MKRAVKKIWAAFKAFGNFISSVVNFVLLFIVYFLGIGLTSLIAKLFKKRFLDLKPNKDSYWLVRKEEKKSIEDYYRMY